MWQDAAGHPWEVLLSPDAIVLRAGERSLTLPSSTWARDIIITPNGERVVVRFDTFDLSLTFVLPTGEAAPLLEHLGRLVNQRRAVEAAGEEQARRAVAALRPRVSSLAVWALIASSFVFVPVYGLIPLIVAALLLILHRQRVPAATEWAHSRKICRAAFCFALVGLPVNGLGTIGWSKFGPNAPDRIVSTPTVPDAGGSDATVPSHKRAVAQTLAQIDNPLERDHNWGLIAAGLFVILLSLTVHEAAHATTAWWLGDDFARRLGRVTLNPAQHIDPFGTIVLPLLLFLMGAGVFGWARPVPVRSENFIRPRRAQILVALAGPGSNLLLAAASLMLWLGIGCSVALLWPAATLEHYASINITEMVRAAGFPLANVIGPVCTILKLSFVLNVFLAFFNLIPIPPLDGSWVLEHLFPRTLGPFYARIRTYGFFIFLLLIYSNALEYLLIPAWYALSPGLRLTTVCTPFS